MYCCSCFILSFYPSLDFWLLLSILFFLGYYTVYSPPAYDLFCSSAYTVAFRLISNQMIPVFTGMCYLDFNFIIQSVNIGSKPEYVSVSPRLRIQDRSSAVLSPFEEFPGYRNFCLAPPFPHNCIQNSIHGNTSFQSSSGRIREVA